MRINREELLRRLDAVGPGLAAREMIEQSACYVFKDGKIITFNDELACVVDSPLDITGAVPAKSLRDLVGKLAEEEIEVAVNDEGTELLVKGKGRRAGFRLEAEILLQYETVETPEEWADLDGDFGDAVDIVGACAHKNKEEALSFVHVAPGFLEACDDYQLVRYPIETPLSRPCIVRQTSLNHVTGLGMTEVSETESWLHFRNPAGLVLSCRRWLDDYPELGDKYDVDGSKVTLPGGLKEAVDKAQVFSAETPEDNQVLVDLQKGKLMIKGESAHGWYKEQKKVKYDGPRIKFLVEPRLLAELANRTNEAVVTADRVKVDAGKFTYIAVLGLAE